jgi:hypothetical protein
MAKTKLEAKQWLADVGFDEATITEIAAKFTPAQMEKIAEGTMRQSDYDRVMNEGKAELARAQADLAAANDRLNTEMAEWATVQAQGGQQTAQMQRDLEKARAQVALLSTRVSTYAQQAGIDPTKALEGLEAAPTVPPQNQPPQAPDLTPFARAEDVQKLFGQFGQAMVTLPAELFAIATEHQELTGKPLDTREITREILARAGTKGNTKTTDPRAIWEELHKVPDLRAAKQQAKYDADIAAAEARGRESALSEGSIPGQTTPTGRHSPLFGGERKSALQRPQPGQTVAAAASAFRSGKYRQEIKKPA